MKPAYKYLEVIGNIAVRFVLKRYYQRGQRIRELEKYLEELER